MNLSTLLFLSSLVFANSAFAGGGFEGWDYDSSSMSQKPQKNIQESPFFEKALTEVVGQSNQPPLPTLEWDALTSSQRAKVAKIVQKYEMADLILKTKINLIESLFTRDQNPKKLSPEAQQVLDASILDLVGSYVLFKGDLEDETSTHLHQQLSTWSQSLPDFDRIAPSEREIGPDEISRRAYVRELAGALALSLKEFEKADGEKKEILRQISVRILAEAFLVSASVEPSPAGVAKVGVNFWSKLFLGPLGLSAFLTITGQDQLAQLTAAPAMMSLLVFLQNVLVRETGSGKPWLVPSQIKKEAHKERLNRILKEFLAELISENPKLYDREDPLLRIDFDKVREKIVTALFSSPYQPLDISVDDCAKALRN